MYTGFSTAGDTLRPLLGKAPDREFVEEIYQTVMAYDDVVGVHDLVVHDYGPGRCMISLHAEVPCDADILKMHDIIDMIEHSLHEKFQCNAVIHMDPIVTDDEETNKMHRRVIALVQRIYVYLNKVARRAQHVLVYKQVFQRRYVEHGELVVEF